MHFSRSAGKTSKRTLAGISVSEIVCLPQWVDVRDGSSRYVYPIEAVLLSAPQNSAREWQKSEQDCFLSSLTKHHEWDACQDRLKQLPFRYVDGGSMRFQHSARTNPFFVLVNKHHVLAPGRFRKSASDLPLFDRLPPAATLARIPVRCQSRNLFRASFYFGFLTSTQTNKALTNVLSKCEGFLRMIGGI